MISFDPAAYGPVLADLVDGDRCRALDVGRPNAAARAQLDAATLDSAFAHVRIVDRDMARACLAGAWLVHDFLDESHAISQAVESPTGSFWHGVMHRREGDFANAKYWFRRVGPHEALVAVAVAAAVNELADAPPDAAVAAVASQVIANGALDPLAFVDACQAALRMRGGAQEYCRRVQQAEWETLFDFSYRRAVGA